MKPLCSGVLLVRKAAAALLVASLAIAPIACSSETGPTNNAPSGSDSGLPPGSSDSGLPPGGSDSGLPPGGSDSGLPPVECVELELLNGEAKPPSNVVVLFGLETCDGDPLPGLTADQFVVHEDSKLISAFDSGQTILPRSSGFELSTALLLDMSGSIIRSGDPSPLLDAARSFVDRVPAEEHVAVYLFDGRRGMVRLHGFTQDKSALRAALDSLTGYTVVNSATNLNGAIVAGLISLDQRRAASTAPISAGSLVVFAEGTDQAGRVSDANALGSVRQTRHSVFTIGIGGEPERAYLSRVGKNGLAFSADASGIVGAFNDIADLLDRRSQRLYAFGYCSPQRSGIHELTLEVENRRGALDFAFRADGFGPGCDPQSIANPNRPDAGIAAPDAGTAEQDAGVPHMPPQPRFVTIPAGSFTMGSPPNEPGRGSDESPQHVVTVSRAFLLQTTEVTQDEWISVMGSNPSRFSSCGGCPVENVSWLDAVAYLNRLSQREGLPEVCYPNGDGSGFVGVSCAGYRLPTEAEWAYATRTGTTTAYWSGDSESDLARVGWYRGNAGLAPHPVGLKPPNAWGLYDVHGNVWEWVHDWYGEYGSGSVTDPTGPATGSSRAYRGGSWTFDAQDCRSAARYWGRPDYHGNDLGFRAARSIP